MRRAAREAIGSETDHGDRETDATGPPSSG